MEVPSLADVNWLAVIAAVVVNMVVGFVWYSKALFAKEWTALVGKSESQLREGATSNYVYTVILGVVEAVFVSFLVNAMGAQTAVDGALVGAMIWFGFILPASLVTALFSQTRKKLWAINYGYHLVTMVLIGAIIAAWPS